MNRCICRDGDHDLDGKLDHCLNSVCKPKRKCRDCTVAYRRVK